LNPRSDRNQGIGSDHHSARRNIPDEAKLAPAIDLDRTDTQQAEITLASSTVRLRRRGGC
jgi:hypothetical protein